VVVIEGDFGMGKSDLLNNFAMSTLPSKSSIFCASGNPFTRNQPFVTWCDILTQYILKYQVCAVAAVVRMSAAARVDDCVALRQSACGLSSPTVALEGILDSGGSSKLAAYGSVLNTILPVNLPATSSASTVKGKRKDRIICALMMSVFKHMVSKFPAVVVIDDCHLMHPHSWDFAVQVCAQYLAVRAVVVVENRRLSSSLSVVAVVVSLSW
jgi:hypothetical protein